MATNTYKIQDKKFTGRNFFSLLDRDVPLTAVVHVRFLPQIFFLCLISVVYIWSGHQAEKRLKAIAKLEVQVEDLRADFTTLKAGYKYASKQSEVIKKAVKIGLLESKEPPYKIIVEKP